MSAIMQVSTKGTFGHFGCGFTVLPRLLSTDCTYIGECDPFPQLPRALRGTPSRLYIVTNKRKKEKRTGKHNETYLLYIPTNRPRGEAPAARLLAKKSLPGAVIVYLNHQANLAPSDHILP